MTALAAGICRRGKPEITHEWSGVLTAGEVAKLCHRGDRDGALDTPEPLESIDPRGEPPALDLLVKFLLKALETCRVCADRLPVCLHNDRLRRWRADDLAEPSEVRRTPGGAAHRADILPEEKRVAPKRGSLASPDRLCTSAAQVPNRGILDCRDIDRCQVTRAPQAGQRDRVPTVGVDPIAGLLGDQRGGHPPADMALLGQLAVAPVPARTCLSDQDERRAFGWPPTDEGIDVTRSCPDGAEGDDVGPVVLGDRRHGTSIVVNIETEVDCGMADLRGVGAQVSS
jgi:hypothetical protein